MGRVSQESNDLITEGVVGSKTLVWMANHTVRVLPLPVLVAMNGHTAFVQELHLRCDLIPSGECQRLLAMTASSIAIVVASCLAAGDWSGFWSRVRPQVAPSRGSIYKRSAAQDRCRAAEAGRCGCVSHI